MPLAQSDRAWRAVGAAIVVATVVLVAVGLVTAATPDEPPAPAPATTTAPPATVLVCTAGERYVGPAQWEPTGDMVCRSAPVEAP